MAPDMTLPESLHLASVWQLISSWYGVRYIWHEWRVPRSQARDIYTVRVELPQYHTRRLQKITTRSLNHYNPNLRFLACSGQGPISHPPGRIAVNTQLLGVHDQSYHPPPRQDSIHRNGTTENHYTIVPVPLGIEPNMIK